MIVTGEHLGNFFVIPPTGRKIAYQAIHIHRIGNDGSPFHFNEDRGFAEGFDDAPHIPPQVALARIIPILVSLVWLGIGIRQWFVLSKWSKKYERYKELQKRIDAKLDYCNNHVEDKGEGQ